MEDDSQKPAEGRWKQLIHRLTGKGTGSVTEEKIISILDDANEQGLIEENEAEMIQNIISFQEKDAGQVMTHRKNVVAFSRNESLTEVVDQMLEEGYSRYPVYGEDMDDIIGIIHFKDAIKFVTKNPWARNKPLHELPGLIRQAAFIPETRSIGDLFRSMQARKIHMAIIVDEYGQTAGIISMEDILEEIVGDILDEYDEDEIGFRTLRDNSILIDAMTSLEDVEEALRVKFGHHEFETLNGYLTSLLGHIPTEEDLNRELVSDGYCFTILSLGKRTIDKVKARRCTQEGEQKKEKAGSVLPGKNNHQEKGEKQVCQDIQNSQI